MNHDDIPDGATYCAGCIITDPMEAAALDPMHAEQASRVELPGRIKARINIVDLIAQDIEIKKAGKDWKACCPFHDEKTPSFTVSRDKQIFHCFGCGVHGDAFTWMQDYHRLSFQQALQALGRQAGVRVPRFFRGADARETQVARELSPKKIAELEDTLCMEAHILLQYLYARQAHRMLSPTMRRRMGDPEPPPAMAEREVRAVKRIVNGFRLLEYPA